MRSGENKQKKAEHFCSTFCRGGRIRTCDLPELNWDALTVQYFVFGSTGNIVNIFLTIKIH